MLEEYLDYIQEGYLLSDKTISVNLHEFENATKNKLLIVGVLGSGKTSLGEHLVKKYKVSNFFSDKPGMENALKSSKRMIIEGGQLATLYKTKPNLRKLIINQPMIIIGMSAIKAGLRADKRDSTLPGKAKNWRDIYYFVRNNLSYFQRSLSFLRRDVVKLSDARIEEYKIPKFKTILY